MELAMANGFKELSLGEMEQIDGGANAGAVILGTAIGVLTVAGAVAVTAATGGAGAPALVGAIFLCSSICSGTAGGLIGYGLMD